ncbi:hypothetical protein NCU07501 [Neurospora crassa OR74A]|uniref:glucan endo-1,3-beta-D-glucosidase n=1 Tax=Neurospora crassa (strain ATCC 24698 / 74-OR23-1A / CBS 708.71 / DSM 1257 / FGSC 987) TaxID=367110 RepID=Q7SG41_NEUCR|nr:hypothetical protein NCU07501 [Neurospora crassa OR74A]EAA35812.1 hypothetical protein NCU07501 [Neurospora crassa OR74A]|eukprot:XP_965048.1 hypothetical protein NCU07501 [Neurospora crassa OR74A]
MKHTIFSMVLAALLALVSLAGVTTGLTIGRDISPSSNTLSIVDGVTNPIDTPVNGLPSSGSSLTRRSYRKSAPYADPHSIDPSILVVADDLCKDHKTFEDGDYYCQKVDQVIYTNVGSSGEYQEVAYMNQETGECRFADVNRTFAGDLAPFNEPVTLIFRGPIHLKQLAVYYPSASGASRDHYYNAASQTSQGLTFLGNRGGEGSGVVGGPFGASLSYVNSHATGGASSSQILANEVITDEFLVMTDQDCDGSCGYVRPGSVAKKGFPGTDRLFLLEFSMPHTAADMPAIWIENARVPYTPQYGGCSCWNSGCGEWDMFEILHAGKEKAETTFHLDPPAGDANWMQRPVDQNAPIKVAVWFDPADGGTASVKVLGRSDGVEFGGQLDAGEVRDLKKRSDGVVSETNYAVRRGQA